ncbi:hypothetical protein SDC9_106844 [bioreactor metagenome]|uniref:Uncharacterized protein n=1 Tax=bioreactor metagenome TaxID=1076179 RepID=A0A645B4M3_9ZZZZ
MSKRFHDALRAVVLYEPNNCQNNLLHSSGGDYHQPTLDLAALVLVGPIGCCDALCWVGRR